MPRLVARVWSVDQAESAFAIYGDPVAMRFMHPHYPLADVAAMRTRIGEIIERNAGWNDRMGSWPLFERNTDVLVGAVLLKPLPGDGPEKIVVGWHLLRSRWGRGYATESGRAALAYGFGPLGLDAIHAIVDPGNTASIRVCERLRMRHLGRTTDYYERELEFFAIECATFPS